MAKRWFVSHSNSPVRIPMSKLGECIDYLKNLLGNEWVSDETRSYRAWSGKHSIPIVWNFRPPNTNLLIPMFAAFDDWCENTKKSKPPAMVIDLASIAGAISYFEPYWSSFKKGAGSKRIKSYLSNTETCRGIIYELTSALHYVRAGATPVTPLFMNPYQTDILITWQGVEIEVHCKSKVPGAGHIHADLFDYLAGCSLAYFNKSTDRSIWLKLICDDILRKDDCECLRERIGNLIQIGLVGDFPLCENHYVLRIREIEIPHNGITVSEIQKLKKPMYRAILADNSLSLIAGHRCYKVCVFDVVSRKRPRAASSLKDSIRQAAERVSGNRPSIVTIHFHDPMDWEEANKLLVFKVFLEQQLKTRRGKNVGALVLTGEPLAGERWTGHVYERSLPYIWFPNPHANPQVQLPANFQLSVNQTI
jgi:hypothetical protein